MTIFNYEKFLKQCVSHANEYREALPYPYAIFDGLFDEDVLNRVSEQVSQEKFYIDERALDGIEVKSRSDFADNEAIPGEIRKVFEVLNGGKFLEIVSKLTGITGLISDPYYDGGGVNIIQNGGTLAVHVDGTTQHRMKVSRRINAILFLNDHWDVDWNGYHEQWEFLNKELSPFDENQKWRCVRKILPKKNRLLVFTTNDHSWHGHAGVLNVPDSVQRQSLISYYYTVGRPKEDILFQEPHRALFIKNSVTLTPEAYEGVEVIL